MATAKKPQCHYEGFPVKRIFLGDGDFIAMRYNHDGNQPEYESEYDVANNVYQSAFVIDARGKGSFRRFLCGLLV